jgi:predicted ATP-grasp superfamily ATP-dependent carboligase
MFYTMAAALAAEGHEVVSPVDARIPEPVLPSRVTTHSVESGEDWEASMRIACQDSELGIVIAPEDEGILPNVIEAVRSTSLEVICPDLETVRLCSDKSQCIELFEDLSLSVPPYLVGTPEEILGQELESIGFPSIVKPSMSSGATHLHLVESPEELESLMDAIEEELGPMHLIVQEHVPGEDVSASLLVSPPECKVLSTNRQVISLGDFLSESGYIGGECPLDEDESDRVSETAVKIVEALPGLKGYVGIDFILADEEIIPLEINSRLTVSAIGISRTRGQTALSAILDCADGPIRPIPEPNGYAAFAESNPIGLEVTPSEDLMNKEGVVSPAVPLDGLSVSPYLCGWGKSIVDARENLGRIRTEIENTWS